MNDPSIKSDIKFDRVNEGLIKIQDKLVRMDEMDPTYTAIQDMMKMECSVGFQPFNVPPGLKIVNIYCQRYKRKNYQYKMKNQHLMFLLTNRDRVLDQFVKGVSMAGDSTEFDYFIGEGAYLTDCFQPAADLMWNRTKTHAIIPVAAVALGGIKIYDRPECINQKGIPLGYDSIWMRGIYGHQLYGYTSFSYNTYKYHLGLFQINATRIQDLSYSVYFVQNPNQVEILFLVEVVADSG